MKPPILWIVGLLLSAACGDGNKSQIMLGVQGNTDLLRPALSVTVRGNGFTQSWRGGDITTQLAPNYTAAIETPRSGKLTVQVDLAPAGNATPLPQIELDARPDWIWQVEIWLYGHNPMDGCMGCMGVRAFPVPSTLQRTSRDSLYIVWGGNSISHPVVY
jgi:hypothetical protein